MISRTWSRKSVAFCLTIAVLSVYSMVSLAAAGQQGQTGPSGELSVSGQVTVNGQSAISGATVFSDSTIVTAPNSSAIVSLGKLGRVELLPDSTMRLSFTANSITGSLDAGRARVSTMAGTSANITTKDGAVVADAAQASVFSIDTQCGNTVIAAQSGNVVLRAGDKVQQVAAGQDATAGQAAPGTRCARMTMNQGGFGHMSGGAIAALLAAAGGAIVAVILATRHSNNLNLGGGTINVVSPTR